MKKIMQRSWLLSLLAGFLFVSCKKEVVHPNTTVTPVAQLSAPAANASLALDPVTGPSISFEWSAATTPDEGVILYELAFDRADGDFSSPIFKIVSDGSGLQTRASVPQKMMNRIAALAGIESSSTGTVKWAVFASKITNRVISSETRSLQIERPAGFATLPAQLYIYGSATEAGDDISKAIPLNKTGDGIFELYTSLKPGSYLLTDKTDGTGTSYYIDPSANNTIKEGTTGTSITAASSAYRLRYDFNVATSETTAINGIGLYMSAYNTEIGQLKYTENSTWVSEAIPVEFYQFSWGRDERYKFVLHTDAGDEYLGSSNANNVAPAGQPASYFYLLPVTNDQWNNTYKFDPSADMKEIKATILFEAGSPYTHNITVL